MQSPIDINTDKAQVFCCTSSNNSKTVVKFVQEKTDSSTENPIDSNSSAKGVNDPILIEHLGFNFQVNWHSFGDNNTHIVVKDKKYHLIQFHFHTLSEHTIDGKRYPLELHLVHQSPVDQSLAVVAVLFEEGEENPFLAQFWDKIPDEPNTKTSIDKLDAEPLSLFSGPYYRYQGSLTTPPYSENVEWIVLKKIRSASITQIKKYRSVLPCENARDLQDINGRDINFHHSQSQCCC